MAYLLQQNVWEQRRRERLQDVAPKLYIVTAQARNEEPPKEVSFDLLTLHE